MLLYISYTSNKNSSLLNYFISILVKFYFTTSQTEIELENMFYFYILKKYTILRAT